MQSSRENNPQRGRLKQWIERQNTAHQNGWDGDQATLGGKVTALTNLFESEENLKSMLISFHLKKKQKKKSKLHRVSRRKEVINSRA